MITRIALLSVAACVVHAQTDLPARLDAVVSARVAERGVRVAHPERAAPLVGVDVEGGAGDVVVVVSGGCAVVDAVDCGGDMRVHGAHDVMALPKWGAAAWPPSTSQTTCGTGASQQWTRQDAGGGYYRQ